MLIFVRSDIEVDQMETILPIVVSDKVSLSQIDPEDAESEMSDSNSDSNSVEEMIQFLLTVYSKTSLAAELSTRKVKQKTKSIQEYLDGNM